MTNKNETKLQEVTEKDSQWGELPKDNFGYKSDEERRAKRGLEDWEMVEHMPDSQKRVPTWFFAVIIAVLLVAIGLSFPFWGVRPGQEKAWLDWGFAIAIVYLIVFGTFVYFMVNYFGNGPKKQDVDQTKTMSEKETKDTPVK